MSDKPMSNEKLGAEQALRQRLRELLYPKIADDKLIADWMWREIDRIAGLTEPAHHARGAGRDFDVDGRSFPNLVKKWEGMERMFSTAMDLQKSRANEELIANYRAKAEVCRDFLKDLAALREPGADTGTTPQGGGRSPNDTSPMYSDDVIAAIGQQKQSTAAERGTTPPEGLRAVLESGLALVESTVAHVSHGGPTRADAEKWIQEARNVLGR